jgi:hypothetical protein
MSNIELTTLWTERKAADNKGFAIAGVLCFADTFVQGGSSVLCMKFSAKTPRHRKPPKPLAPMQKDILLSGQFIKNGQTIIQ